MLDTSVWIDALQGKPLEIIAVTRRLLHDDRVRTCGPVLYEIKRGLRPSERKKILPLFDALIRLSWEEPMWNAPCELITRTDTSIIFCSARTKPFLNCLHEGLLQILQRPPPMIERLVFFACSGAATLDP